jgi:tetratricopeptide (TPR) repeat protein
MKNLTLLFLIMIFSVFSCSEKAGNPGRTENEKKTKAWLPAPEYQPKNPKAKILNDSAAILQIQAQQDPTLEPLDRFKLIEQAFNMLNEALKMDPDYGLAMSNLAAIYLEKRDTSKALELMQRRLDKEPDMAEGWQAVGVFSDMLGDSSKAKSCYEKSINIYDSRLKMGKEYALSEDLLYYYDNWSGKAFSLLLLGRTTEAHNSIRALLDEAGVVLGQDAETYAAMLNKDRWLILKEMKGE